MIEKVFVELIEFIDGSSEAQLLVKVSDISEFIKRSFDKLEKMATSGITLKKDIYISDKLRPYIVDTKKSLTFVNSFEMVPPSKDMFNNFELKFLQQKPTHAESKAKLLTTVEKKP